MDAMSPLGAGAPQLPPMPLPLHMVGALADPSSPAPMALTKDGKIPKKRGGARKKGFDMHGNPIDSVPRSPSSRGRGRGSRGARTGTISGDRPDRSTPEPGSPAPPSGRGRGRGRGGPRGGRGKRGSGPAGRGDSASNAGTPGGPTPGASTGLPYDMDTPGNVAFTPGDSNGGREASVFSGTTRRSGNARGRNNVERGDGETEYDEEEEDDDDMDMEAEAPFADGVFDEELVRQRAEEKEARGLLVEQFDEEQMQRYTEFTRSRFQPGNIRKLINNVLQQSCTPNIVQSVSGLAKVFIGEIVESARKVQAEGGHEGPLAPDDVREAYMRYKAVRDKRGSQRSKLFVR